MYVREDAERELRHEKAVDLNDVVTGQYDIENPSFRSLATRITSGCR
jgi:hypothetical protein